jgi:eukaryotic-like serine/threonine-protein kinase
MTQTIPFPGVADYFKAVQAPARAFTVPSLQTAKFEWDSLGPRLARGASAVVFTARVSGSQQAVRCYIRNDASSRERYSALDAYLASHNLNPFVSSTIWLEEAIKVNGATWPVLQMIWIDGRTLNEYVDYLVATHNTGAITMLAANWRELVNLMQTMEFAHGDLQHANIMVDQAGTFRLVDYDGVWIPQLARMARPTEYGQANYQHPGLQEWGRWFDTFSALVIYLSLVAIGKNPELWPSLYNGTNLLFTKADFARFDTPAWQKLAELRDPEVNELARRLRDCCDLTWVANQSLEHILDTPAPAPPPPPPPPPPSPSPLPPGLDEWWKKLPATATPATPPSQPTSSAWSQPPPAPAPAPPPPIARTSSTPPTGVSMAALGSLPAPPPLSAPLDVGSGPMRVVNPAQKAPAGWWKQPQASPASQPTPAATGTPGTPAKPAGTSQGQRRSLGGLALGLGILFLIIGLAEKLPAGTWVGLVLAAVGLVLFISGSGGSGSSGSSGGSGGSGTGTAGTAAPPWPGQNPGGQAKT